MSRLTAYPRILLLTVCLATSLLGASPARGRPRLDGPAIVVGFHITPAGPGDALSVPRSPQELKAEAPASGSYDAWLYVFTRAPLVGAWSLNVGLDYDGRPEQGIDLLDWQNLADQVRPRAGWPEAGAGFGAEFVWDRARCWDPDGRLMKGDDGWWVQPACRLRLRVYSPDCLALADPEPNVRPAEVECRDEGHDLDGTDNWTGVMPACFGGGGR